MTIDERQTRRIAALALLELDDRTVARFCRQLESVLGHVATLAELDLSDVPPTSRVGGATRLLAPDVPGPSLGSERATRGAADARDGVFLVPRVIEPGAPARGGDDG